MIKLLYRLFRGKFNELAFIDQNAKNTRQGLRFGFVMDEKNYYVYSNVFDMPMIRLGKIQVLLGQLSSCVSSTELDAFILDMQKALDEATSGSAVKSIGKIGFLTEELKRRKEMLVHPDLMLRICAACCIAEDEDPTVWNEEHEYKKFDRIKHHYSGGGGLFPFFRSIGLTQFLPEISNIESDFTQYWESAKTKLQAYDELKQQGII